MWNLVIYQCLRRCRNWQTSKTKDLVGAISCGFKSHSPQSLRLRWDMILTATHKKRIWKKQKKVIDKFCKMRYYYFVAQEWRNWQTRTVQVRVKAISWGFKSPFLQKGFEGFRSLFISYHIFDIISRPCFMHCNCSEPLGFWQLRISAMHYLASLDGGNAVKLGHPTLCSGSPRGTFWIVTMNFHLHLFGFPETFVQFLQDQHG